MACMWNKIYLILLAISIAGMAISSYLANDWLSSIGNPQTAAENYRYFSNLGWTFLLISSLVLLIAGNIVLFKLRKAWALWATFLYFAVFVILKTFWLGDKYFQFKQDKNLADSSIFLGSFVGILFIAIALILVFFDQFIVGRMQEKMFPQNAAPNQIPVQDSIPLAENNADSYSDPLFIKKDRVE